MTISHRIQEIIKSKGLTASKFADVVGVQRSGISHVLSGRNNPSLDLIQKILSSFSDVNAEWLVNGKGKRTKEAISSPIDEIPFKSEDKQESVTNVTSLDSNLARENDNSGLSDLQEKSGSEQNFDQIQSEKPVQKEADSILHSTLSSARKLSKIVLLYDDGSFDSYEQ